MKTLWIGCSTMMAVSAMAASLNVEPDKWVATSQNATVTQAAGGAFTASFATPSGTTAPKITRASVYADATVSAGAFVGNYLDVGARGVTFTLNHTGGAGSVSLVIRLPSGKSWNKNVTLPAVSGVAVPFVVPFTAASGWMPGYEVPADADLDALLQSVIMYVAKLGFEVSPAIEAPAQTYTVDAFILGGSGTIPSALDSKILDALRSRFGSGINTYADVTNEQKAIDTDTDGMSDYLEILVGTNWNDGTSVFAAAIVEQTPVGTKIKWPSQAGATYTVWRSSDLTTGFYPLEAGWLAAANGTVTEYTDTTTGDATKFFYKVSQD